MDITILNILYVVLIFFILIVGTLLSIVLYKVSRILDSVIEMVEMYEKIKQVISMYNRIPEMILEKIKSRIFGK